MLMVNNDPYVEARDGNAYVGKTRVTLITVVTAWKQGETPAQIHDDFPTVSLASVYGAIAYYLAHQEDVDAYMSAVHENALRMRAEAEAANPQFYATRRARIEAARERLHQEQLHQDDTDAPLSAEHQSA